MSDLASVLRAVDVAEPVEWEVERRVLEAAADVLGANGWRRRWLRRLPTGPVAAAAAVLVVVVGLVASFAALRGDSGGTALSAADSVPFHGSFVTQRAGAADTTTEVWYRDQDHRRIEGPEGLTVTDGDYVLLHGGFVDDEHEEKGMYVRNEYRRGMWQGPLSYWEENGCRGPETVMDDPPVRVLHRPTRHFRCPVSGAEPVDHWVDVATGLVLRMAYGDLVQEVTSLELDPAGGLGDDRFSTKIPAGGVNAAEVQREDDEHPLGRRIKPGAQLAIVESLEAIRGDSVTVPALPPKGRWTLVLVTAPWCVEAGCGAGWDELQSGSHKGVIVVSTMAAVADSREAFSSWTSDVPVVHAVEDDLKKWDLNAVPTWIVFNDEGEVVDGAVAILENLDAVLDAVAADRRPPQLDQAAPKT